MRADVIWRVGWTIVVLIGMETGVCGLAAMPVFLFWLRLAHWAADAGGLVRMALLSAAAVPSYILFALGPMVWSALATRLTGARTTPDVEMRIADMDWPLLAWARVHGRHPSGSRLRQHPVPRLADLDLVSAPERCAHRPSRLREQHLHQRSQSARVRRRCRDQRGGASVGSPSKRAS